MKKHNGNIIQPSKDTVFKNEIVDAPEIMFFIPSWF